MDIVGVSRTGGGSAASGLGLIEALFLSGPANDDEGPGESGLSPQAEGSHDLANLLYLLSNKGGIHLMQLLQKSG